VTIVEPGPFRTNFLTAQSLRFGDNAVPDYDDRRAQLRAGLEERDGSTTTTLSFLASERCERPPRISPESRIAVGESGRITRVFFDWRA